MLLSVLTKTHNFLRVSARTTLGYARAYYFNKPSPVNSRVFNLKQYRLISFYRAFKKPDARLLKIKDNIPASYDLIYRNSMENYLFVALLITTTSAFFVAIATIFENDIWHSKLNVDNWRVKPKVYDTDMLVATTAFIFICVIIQSWVYKMPIRIYNFPKQNHYIFVFHGNLPFTKSQIACFAKDVTKLEERGILPWNDAKYEVREQRNIILLENNFRRPADLNIMLGYQKHEDSE